MYRWSSLSLEHEFLVIFTSRAMWRTKELGLITCLIRQLKSALGWSERVIPPKIKVSKTGLELVKSQEKVFHYKQTHQKLTIRAKILICVEHLKTLGNSKMLVRLSIIVAFMTNEKRETS